MLDPILQRIFASQWSILFQVGAILLIMVEVGYWSGLRLFRAHDERRKGLIPGTAGAILGLLGLLLGFTFAIAASRYESRRNLVLQEANAIGTTYLRAAFLPDALRPDAESLLRRYVDARLRFYTVGTDRDAAGKAEHEATEIQRSLWADAVEAGRQSPTPTVALFVSSLNDVIDIDEMRVTALLTHVPGAVWALVLVVSSAACWASGYQAGANGARSGMIHLLLPVLITVVITLIADLDRPRSGLIGISQQPLIDLQKSWSADQVAPPDR